jgi:hypothetical protein
MNVLEAQNPGNIKAHLGQIQGNIIGGFNKDYQTFLFLKFNRADRGRSWLGSIIPEIATSEEVKAFNALFKVVRYRSGREGIVKASWTNIAFSHSGLKALGVNQGELDQFPKDFKDGLAARANDVGDCGASAPENWVGLLGSKDVHALFLGRSE